jgi:hypothetical protein
MPVADMVGLTMAWPSLHGAWILRYTPAGADSADTPLSLRPLSSSAGTGMDAASSWEKNVCAR